MRKTVTVAVLVAVFGFVPAALAGMHLVTTPAGCTAAFKHQRGLYDTCLACVKSKGKFKEHAGNKGWACER